MKIVEGEPWPKQRSAVTRLAQKVFLGPTGPNAAVVDWHRTNVSKIMTGNWPRVPGDPAALPWWPHSWEHGAALAVPPSFVTETLREEPTAVEGAAFLSALGSIVAGRLPEGRTFGNLSGWATMVGRTGRGTQVMSPVMIVPETSRLFIPPEVELLGQRIAIGNAALL